MTLRILITPKASQDLDDLFDYMAQNNPDAALRFLMLLDKPSPDWHRIQVWGPYLVNNHRLEGLRKRGVKNFEKYLIFFFIAEDLLTVIRIIYATRDVSKILEQEE